MPAHVKDDIPRRRTSGPRAIQDRFDTFEGFYWGTAGQRILDKDCVVAFEPRNVNLLRPVPGVVTDLNGGSRPDSARPSSVHAGRSR